MKLTMRESTLLSIFRMMRPGHVYVRRDFRNISPNDRARQYLNVLIRLGLVERCEAINYRGNKRSIKIETEGYRLINHVRVDAAGYIHIPIERNSKRAERR